MKLYFSFYFSCENILVVSHLLMNPIVNGSMNIALLESKTPSREKRIACCLEFQAYKNHKVQSRQEEDPGKLLHKHSISVSWKFSFDRKFRKEFICLTFYHRISVANAKSDLKETYT